MPLPNSIGNSTLSSLFEKDIQPEAEIANDENQQIYQHCIPESGHYVQEDTTFVVTKEKVVINKKSKYRTLEEETHRIEDAVGTNGCVADLMIQQEENTSRCLSGFKDLPSFVRSDEYYTYETGGFESEATIKLPIEIQQKSGSFYFLQFSKIYFKQDYVNIILHMLLSPQILKEEEYCLDCCENVEAEYSVDSFAKFDSIPDKVNIKLWDRPSSRMYLSFRGSPLTKVERSQEFLVYLLMEIDGKLVILHALKWFVELYWSAESPDNPRHFYKITSNEEEIPRMAFSYGKCNDNQMWYLEAGKNSEFKSGVVFEDPKFTNNLSSKDFRIEAERVILDRLNRNQI